MPHRTPLPAAAALVALGALAAAAAVPSLALSPGAPRQGEAIFLRLEAPAEAAPIARWLGKEHPLFPAGDAWTVVLPVPPDTPAGRHSLVVSCLLDGREERVSRTVPVSSVPWGVQRLKMAARTASLYRYPGVEKEEREISAAIRTRSDRRLWSGDWILPVRGRFSTAFGVRRIRNGAPVGRHRGLDIAAPTGTPVRAAAAGRVVLARSYRKHGMTVVLDHGQGVTSFYIHMSALTVKEGESVPRGAPIGKVGSTGVATGPHLHWSVYAFGEPLQPLFFTRLTARGVPRDR